MSRKYRLKGHETFMLREGWLNKGLQAVSEDQKAFAKHYGADVLGVGTNMAKAIRYWLKAGGLALDIGRAGVSLTEMGWLIHKYDAYFEDPFSLWIYHIHLVENKEQATAWYLFFHTDEIHRFTKDRLYVLMEDSLCSYAGEEEITVSSLRADCDGILKMYGKERQEDYDPEDKKISPFASLGLLKQEEQIYEKVTPALKTLSEDVILYLIVKAMEEEESNALAIEELLKREGGPGKILNMKRSLLEGYLNTLEEQGQIRVDRTAGLDQIYLMQRYARKEDVVKRHYEKLRERMDG